MMCGQKADGGKTYINGRNISNIDMGFEIIVLINGKLYFLAWLDTHEESFYR